MSNATEQSYTKREELIPFDYEWPKRYELSGKWQHPDTIWPVLIPRLLGDKFPPRSLLDVGGGPGILAVGWWQSNGVPITVVDPYDPPNPLPNDVVFIQSRGQDVPNLFHAKFDVVQATEVLEHVKKVDGHDLIESLKKVTKHLLIMTTPAGAQPHQNVMFNNPTWPHISGWSPDELAEHDMSVILNTTNGPKPSGDGSMIAWWKP